MIEMTIDVHGDDEERVAKKIMVVVGVALRMMKVKGLRVETWRHQQKLWNFNVTSVISIEGNKNG